MLIGPFSDSRRDPFFPLFPPLFSEKNRQQNQMKNQLKIFDSLCLYFIAGMMYYYLGPRKGMPRKIVVEK